MIDLNGKNVPRKIKFKYKGAELWMYADDIKRKIEYKIELYNGIPQPESDRGALWAIYENKRAYMEYEVDINKDGNTNKEVI